MNLDNLEAEHAFALKQYKNTLEEIYKLEQKATLNAEYVEAIEARIRELKGDYRND